MADTSHGEIEQQAPSAVVGIGASAGGLEALEAVFRTAPDNNGFAYVVVTHLSPNFKSLMDELLSQHTSMSVQQVEDGMTILANHVYVIPPNTEMIAVSGRLLLSDRDPGNQIALPIDTFFRSLAREYGRRAIAVVLSGTGGDGSHALQAIRESGGHVIVQDPETAKFDGMPRASMATGAAEAVLSPEAIGEALFAYDPNRGYAPPPRDYVLNPEDPEQDALDLIFAALFGTSSINFEAYKTNTVLRRINRRMVTRRVGTIGEYAELVQSDPGEVDTLNRDLLIGVTTFFRDTEAFEQLDTLVLSELAREYQPDRPIRIWTPGCATGQEAYSIAMLLQRQFDEMGIEGEAQIFATDLQRDFIDAAGRGVFPAESFPAEWDSMKRAYMTLNEDGKLQVEPRIRRMVVFAHHNVLSDPPFTRLDLVICRNMLIYFQPEAQERALSLISFGIRRSGFLFLGPSETLGGLESSFTLLSKRWRIYRKERELAAIQMPERRPPGMHNEKLPASHLAPARQSRSRQQFDLMPAYSAMLDRFAPPGILIDQDRQLLHTFGNARDLLRPPLGVASLDLLDMVPDWMRLPLATAIDRVARDGEEVRYVGDSPDGEQFDIVAVPLDGSPEGRKHFKLVLLNRAERVDEERFKGTTIQVLDNSTITSARIQDLENELRHTKENLQATIEEVVTSNEELQSTNEELMAANEELQSTNEELHSVNEELYSVNAEYQRKNDELSQLNRDVEALMASTDVGVIFVDDRLAVRRFTSPAKRVFNLIDEDQGRSLAHLTHTLTETDIVSIARRAVDQFLSSEHECQSEDGTWWLLRCMPMKTPGSNAIGAIITAIDIDDIHRTRQKAEKDQWRQGLISEIGQSFIVTSDNDMRIKEVAEGWQRYTGQKFHDYSGAGWMKAIHPEDAAGLAEMGPPDLDMSGSIKTHYRLWHADSRSYRQCQVTLVPEIEADGNQIGWTGILVDVEDTLDAQARINDQAELLRTVTAELPGMICLLNVERQYQFVNQGYQERWGGNEPLLGKSINDVLPKDVLEELEHHLLAAFSGEKQEFLVRRSEPGGRQATLLVQYVPHMGRNDQIVGVAVCVMDVSATLAEELTLRDLAGSVGKAMLSGASENLIVSMNNMAVLHVSKGAKANLKRSDADILKLKLFDLLPEYDADRLEHLFRQSQNANAANIAAHNFKTFVLRGDGSSYDAEIHVDIEPEGLPDCVLLSLRDTSEAQATQKILRERNEELARSNSDLENFAYFASHDLQEPARKIGNFAGLVDEDLGDTATEETREYLEIIRRSSDRMLTLIRDLLTFSRIRVARDQFSEVDLNPMLKEIAEDQSLDLKSAGGSLKIGKLPHVQGDSMLLGQLFTNLIGNAIKYREPDRALEIDIAADHVDGQHRISISDNGMGFEPEDSEQVFGLFQRLHGPSGIPGSGVGLAICKRVVELHGGDIKVDAAIGRGATFIITLP